MNAKKILFINQSGIPLIPCAVNHIINDAIYGSTTSTGICWFREENSLPFYLSFVLPVACIMMINAILFSMVIFGLFKESKKLRSTQSERDQQRKRIRAAISCFVLIGELSSE